MEMTIRDEYKHKIIFNLCESKTSFLMVWDACGFPEGLTFPPVPLRIVTLCSLTGSLLRTVPPNRDVFLHRL